MLNFLSFMSANIEAYKKLQVFCILKRPPLVLPVVNFYSLNGTNAIKPGLILLGRIKVGLMEIQGWLQGESGVAI